MYLCINSLKAQQVQNYSKRKEKTKRFGTFEKKYKKIFRYYQVDLQTLTTPKKCVQNSAELS